MGKRKAAGSLEHKFVTLAKAKALEEGPGGFEGYASVFNVRDDGGDIVAPGAFAGTIEQFVKRGFLSRSHDWYEEIGTIADAREDDYGLFIRAEYHTTDDAQRARVKAAERIERGKGVYLSIGYLSKAWEDTPDGRNLKDIELFEVAQVPVPMLRPAEVIGVKDGLAQLRAGVNDLLSQAAYKDGRVLSAANREGLEEIAEALEGGSKRLRTLLKETAPQEEDGKRLARGLFLDWQRNLARLNGAAI